MGMFSVTDNNGKEILTTDCYADCLDIANNNEGYGIIIWGDDDGDE